MRWSRLPHWVVALLLTTLTPGFALQEERETESQVPELTSFHDIIYPIWHTAYPEKDYAALRKFAPEVRSHAEKIYAAKLPGILRDKEAKWREGVEEFRKAVETYLAAAASDDDAALLSAAELLHAKYEMLVRIIRPVLKEVDAFHRVLYVVYHKHLPDQNYEAIASRSEEMVRLAEAILAASLPRRLEGKEEAFRLASRELLDSTQDLLELAKSGPGPAMAAAVERVHTAYQSLEKVFD